MKKIIGIDLDEILAETVNEVLIYNKYKFKGMSIKRKDITDYYMWHIPKYKATIQEGIDFFWNSLKSPNIKPTRGAKEKLKEFKKKSYKIIIVTARMSEIKKETINWLNKHYEGLFDHVYFANHFTKKSETKSQICKKFGIGMAIEDNLDYAREMADHGIKVWLMDKPWNKGYNKQKDKNIIKFKIRNEVKI